MPHISRRKLSAAVEKTAINQLLTLSGEGGNGRRALAELFTDTEQIMLAKRLAAIVLFLEGASPYRVWNTLKLSPSTAARLRNDFDSGEFQAVEKIFYTRKRREKFWQSLEKFSRGGLPEMGRGRWAWLAEMDKK